MLKILALDPSGTGTTGILLIKNQTLSFREFSNSDWTKHLTHLMALIQAYQPTVILYENTNYLHARQHQGTVSLLKLMGALEGLKFTFEFIEKLESVLVNQVKELKSKLFKGTKLIPDLVFKSGQGWFYEQQRISLHQLDAFLVYHLWKEKNA